MADDQVLRDFGTDQASAKAMDEMIATADGAQSLENDLRFIIAELKKEGKVTTNA